MIIDINKVRDLTERANLKKEEQEIEKEEIKVNSKKTKKKYEKYRKKLNKTIEKAARKGANTYIGAPWFWEDETIYKRILNEFEENGYDVIVFPLFASEEGFGYFKIEWSLENLDE